VAYAKGAATSKKAAWGMCPSLSSCTQGFTTDLQKFYKGLTKETGHANDSMLGTGQSHWAMGVLLLLQRQAFAYAADGAQDRPGSHQRRSVAAQQTDGTAAMWTRSGGIWRRRN